MLNKPPSYRSYLFVFWEERSSDPTVPSVWRFSLKDTQTGWRRGFASLEEMLVYLGAELVGSEDDPPQIHQTQSDAESS